MDQLPNVVTAKDAVILSLLVSPPIKGGACEKAGRIIPENELLSMIDTETGLKIAKTFLKIEVSTDEKILKTVEFLKKWSGKDYEK